MFETPKDEKNLMKRYQGKWENSGRKKLVIIWVKKVLKVFNALTPMSDQHRISPYNIIIIIKK